MATFLKYAMWAFVIGISSGSFASDITVRVVDEDNAKPLMHVPVIVSYHYDEQNHPASDRKIMTLTTDAKGEARLPLPDPAPKKIAVSVRLSQNKWDCVCSARVSTDEIIQNGIVTAYKRYRPSIKAAPGEIVISAHRLPFWVQLFRPLYKD